VTNIASTVNEVEGKVAIVTGAASGIGRSIATLLHARGAKVVAEDIDPTVEDLACDGIVTLVADVTAEGSAEKAVALAIDTFGKLDILVNNAGRIIYKNLIDLSREEWDWQMQTNVTGAFLHSREAQKAMMINRSGAIVNIASYASYFAFPGCQSAFKFDPVSASNFDPFERRVLTVALASSEPAGVAETWRARAA
jgi:NAD(P)-dependent dehydrogenase (short-subunit alcohol dehydrogenase family)